jgi:hypothetical protein
MKQRTLFTFRRPGRATASCSVAAGLFIAATAQAAPGFSEWGEPRETVGGGCPIESRNGNILYTASGSSGTLDIWTYRREGRKDDFGDRTRLEAPVSLDDADDFCPTPLRGNWLLFVSDRAEEGACGGTDIYLARYRPYPPKPMGDAIRLACAPDGPNTAGTELSPSLFNTQRGTFLYYSSNVGGDQDIYESKMAPDGTFSEGKPVAELNTGMDDRQPNVSRDGLTVVFASDRDTGGFDIFMSTRENLNSPWSEPRNLSVELNFPSQPLGETRPSLSWDLKRLYYGAAGTIYVSERTPGN